MINYDKFSTNSNKHSFNIRNINNLQKNYGCQLHKNGSNIGLLEYKFLIS